MSMNYRLLNMQGRFRRRFIKPFGFYKLCGGFTCNIAGFKLKIRLKR